MLQQMKNKVSMGWDDGQSTLDRALRGRDSPNTGKEQQKAAAAKAAQLEEHNERDLKKPSEPHASSSKDNSDNKSTDGPNRLKQNRVTRWIDLALRSAVV